MKNFYYSTTRNFHKKCFCVERNFFFLFLYTAVLNKNIILLLFYIFCFSQQFSMSHTVEMERRSVIFALIFTTNKKMFTIGNKKKLLKIFVNETHCFSCCSESELESACVFLIFILSRNKATAVVINIHTGSVFFFFLYILKNDSIEQSLHIYACTSTIIFFSAVY